MFAAPFANFNLNILVVQGKFLRSGEHLGHGTRSKIENDSCGNYFDGALVYCAYYHEGARAGMHAARHSITCTGLVPFVPSPSPPRTGGESEALNARMYGFTYARADEKCTTEDNELSQFACSKINNFPRSAHSSGGHD